MKVYINGRFLTQMVTGVQRVAEEIIKEINALLDDNQMREKYEFTVLVPRDQYRELILKNIQVKQIGFLKGHAWEQFELPLYTRGYLLINFCNTGPMFKKNQIVYIHDAAVCSASDGFSITFLTWYKLLYRSISTFTRSIITVSQFSENELKHYFPKMSNKIKVTHIGVDHVFSIKEDSSILTKYNLVDKNFILAVSSMNPNKNFKIINEAISLMKDFKGQVVIAGAKQANVFAENEIPRNSRIKWIGYVTDEELVALYSHAKVFIFPSLYEGFGLPPLEAMALGCPVIASNHSSIPEVCQENVLYFNPYSTVELADKLYEIYNNNALSLQLSNNGKEFAKRYNWSSTVKQLFQKLE